MCRRSCGENNSLKRQLLERLFEQLAEHLDHQRMIMRWGSPDTVIVPMQPVPRRISGKQPPCGA
jgi:hypothetical protein